MIDLSQFSQDDLIALKAKLDGLTDVSGRSPVRPRQLHDLTLLPTKDDPLAYCRVPSPCGSPSW